MKAELAQSFDLSGRTAVVTGGGGQLGRQFCATLSGAGAAVLVVDINAEAAGKKRQWSNVALLIANERKCNVCTI